MSKQLYEEAIADLKKVKEIAEDNAKRAVVEAVAPRIRELIEKELLGESLGEDESSEDEEKKDKILIDEPSHDEEETSVESISFSEVVTGVKEEIDNDATLDELASHLMSISSPNNINELNQKLRYVEKVIETLTAIKGNIKESKTFSKDISQLGDIIATVYSYIQEHVENPTVRLGYSLKIRKCLEKLEKLQETKMKRNLLGEEKVTIELDLPGIDLGDALENAAVDLVLDEEGDEDMEDLESEETPGEEEPSAEESSEEEAPEAEEASEEEGLLEMDDDSVVEIDESMLRREIAFMKLLRESDESVQDVDGSAPGADEFDDFGGASEEGEALELELSESYMDETVMDETDPVGPANAGTAAAAAHTDKKPGSVDEEDELLELDMDDESDDDDGYDLEEMNSMDQAQDVASLGGRGEGDVEQSAKQLRQPSNESIRSQMAKELKLQESLRKRASELKKLYESYKVATSRAKTLLERKDATTNSSKLKAAYAVTAQRYNGSVTRFNKLSESLSKGTAKNSTRSNNVAKPDASAGSDTLSKKLAETNLLNAKLLFTNKLLQTESLTARQKAQVIEQLDAAETVREAKLVYESLAKALVKPRRTVTEGRVLGSSSQATRAASTQTTTLNEGVEAERWARLAGIK
jgi:hypothetical protein